MSIFHINVYVYMYTHYANLNTPQICIYIYIDTHVFFQVSVHPYPHQGCKGIITLVFAIPCNMPHISENPNTCFTISEGHGDSIITGNTSWQITYLTWWIWKKKLQPTSFWADITCSKYHHNLIIWLDSSKSRVNPSYQTHRLPNLCNFQPVFANTSFFRVP